MTDNPELALAISYAPSSAQPALAALFQLDAELAAVPRATSEPTLAQMRLLWWHDALNALDDAPAPATPVLKQVEATVLRFGIGGTELAAVTAGWEYLVDAESIDDTLLDRYGRARGGMLFSLAARLCGQSADPGLIDAGSGWALCDLARHLRDPVEAERAIKAARPRLAAGLAERWRPDLRALGALTHLARMDSAVPLDRPIPFGAPRRVLRLAWHKISGL